MRKARLIEEAENGCVIGDGSRQIRYLCERARYQTEWYAVRWKRLHQLVEESDIPEELKVKFSAVMANGTTDTMELPTYDHVVNGLNAAIAQALALTDTGSHAHKLRFDPDDVGEIPAGWRVVEAIRERLLDGQKYSKEIPGEKPNHERMT